MDQEFKRELIKITYANFLLVVASGLIIAFGSYCFARMTEHYKAVEAKRAEGVTTFVEATNELWTKAYAYEDAQDTLAQLQDQRTRFFHAAGEAQEMETRLDAAEAQVRTALEDFRRTSNAKRPILGESITLHFWKYAGMVNCRADARKMVREADNDAMRKQDVESVAAFTKMIQRMRFDANVSREMAIAALPS